jgi:hypothetical protein
MLLRPGPRLAAIITCLLFFLLPAPAPAASTDGWPPGFRDWLRALTYEDEDPEDLGAPVSQADKNLLERFRPRIFRAPGGRVPVDFYGFYLPNTVVRDESGKVVRKSPTRAFLKKIERRAGWYLDYEGPDSPCEDEECRGYVGTGYGRVYRERARFRTASGMRELPVIILKYNFAFTYSGLPAETGWLKEAIAGIVMDPSRVHELDIHGAVQIVLSEKERPLVLLLAQHNYFRSYVFGVDIPAMPRDNRYQVCFALRSNEPYPCPPGKGPVRRRTVGNPVNMAHVIDGRGRPLLSGMDVVYGPGAGAEEVSYTLRFLPTRAPLYVSWIPLGNRERGLRFLNFYRTGPPGMDLNTWPELKKYSDIMQFWYLRDGSSEDADLMQGAFRSFTDVDFEKVLGHNGRRLYEALEGLLKEGPSP